jgi:plastocyanin
MRNWLAVWLAMIGCSTALCASGCDDDSSPPAFDLSALLTGDLAIHTTGDAATNASVDVTDDFYAPSNVTISKGGTVTWTWRGSELHTVTSDASSTEMFDSSPAQKTGTFMHTFNNAGAFSYHCTIHSAQQTGVITVQ